MNSKLLVICIAVLLVVAFAEAKKSKGKGKGKGMMKCLGEDIKFDDDAKKAWKKCREDKKAKADTEEDDDEDKEDKKKKWMEGKACMTDCIYRKMDYITSDGKLNSDKIEAGIKNAYPEAVQDKIIAYEKKCVELVTETLSTDDNCKSIKEYATCHMKAVFSNCKSKDSKKKDKVEKEE